jgi:hypothetical protein
MIRRYLRTKVNTKVNKYEYKNRINTSIKIKLRPIADLVKILAKFCKQCIAVSLNLGLN